MAGAGSVLCTGQAVDWTQWSTSDDQANTKREDPTDSRFGRSSVGASSVPTIASEVKQSFHPADINLIEVSSIDEALRRGLTWEIKMRNSKGKNTG